MLKYTLLLETEARDLRIFTGKNTSLKAAQTVAMVDVADTSLFGATKTCGHWLTLSINVILRQTTADMGARVEVQEQMEQT
jgi:hypothetical protein